MRTNLKIFLFFLIINIYANDKNLIKNGDMEEVENNNELKFWKFESARPEIFIIETSRDAKSGEKSLLIKSKGGEMSGYMSQIVPVEGGKKYLLRGWYKLKNGKILIWVTGNKLDKRFYSESINSLLLYPNFIKAEYTKLVNPFDWHYFEMIIDTPKDCNSIKIGLGIYFSIGEVLYDSITLEEIKE